MTAEIQKVGNVAKNSYEGDAFDVYCKGSVPNVPDASFEALWGHPIPNTNWDRSAPLGFNDTISQGVYLEGGLGKGIYNLVAFVRSALIAVGKKELANNVLFAMNLPWRNVGRMTGILTDDQVFALLDVINRKKGSVKAFLKSCIR